MSDRHLVQVSDTRRDTTGAMTTNTVNLTMNVPRTEQYSLEQVVENLQLVLAMVCTDAAAPPVDANKVAALLRGES